MTQYPALKVGQIWLLREQCHRVKITYIGDTLFTIEYQHPEGHRETATRDLCNRNGPYYTNSSHDISRDMVTCIYDPET